MEKVESVSLQIIQVVLGHSQSVALLTVKKLDCINKYVGRRGRKKEEEMNIYTAYSASDNDNNKQYEWDRRASVVVGKLQD